jgi:tetratricopeptide (TPR) repeat protein
MARDEVLATAPMRMLAKRGKVRRHHEDAPAEPSDAKQESSPAGDNRLGAYAVTIRVCSDAARRSLAHRRAIWLNQLDQAGGIGGWIGVYRRADGQCELPHWRDRKELLDLIQQRISSPPEVTALLAAAGDTKAQDFVRRQLLRRAVTPELASASTPSDSVNWALAEAALNKVREPQRRLAELRKICEQNPQSVGCALRLISALIAAGNAGDALSLALRLREDGRATPALMQQIGDLLVGAGRKPEAMRAYSEIVEFSPNDPAARQLLGDVYLRHGWYDLAYRQYKTLVQSRPDDPLATLRLAAAAAGTGRVDEAVRLERKIAGGEGEPGPNDPRRWARLWSAARIARLMTSVPKGSESLKQSMERSLRRLQVLGTPGVLFLLTWEDLGSTLGLELGEGLTTTDRADASRTGLRALTVAPAQQERVAATVVRGAGSRPVRFQLTVIVWDGRRLAVSHQAGSVGAEREAVTIPIPR